MTKMTFLIFPLCFIGCNATFDNTEEEEGGQFPVKLRTSASTTRVGLQQDNLSERDLGLFIKAGAPSSSYENRRWSNDAIGWYIADDAGVILWENSSSLVDIVAYMPFQEGMQLEKKYFSISPNQSDESRGDLDSDLLWCSMKMVSPHSSTEIVEGEILLALDHMMSRVEVSALFTNMIWGDEEPQIIGVTFNDLYVEREFDLYTGEFGTFTELKSAVQARWMEPKTTRSEATDPELLYGAILMPQTIVKESNFFDIKLLHRGEERLFSCVLKRDISLDKGLRYRFNVSFQENDQVVYIGDDIVVSGWNETDIDERETD